MKRIFLTLISLFLFPYVFYAQFERNKTIEIIYAKAYKNHKDLTKTEPKIMKDLEYELLCNGEESRFEYIQKMSNDGSRTNKRFIGRGGGKGVYYKNLIEQKKIHQRAGLDEKIYLIKDKFNNLGWNLLKEKKTIQGYECFKAITTRKEYSYIRNKEIILTIEAWYAPSIPLPFGPAGIDGLPGLILEASTSSFYFIAQKIQFSGSGKKIERPNIGKEVTYKEYNELLYKAFKKRTDLY